MIERLSRAAKKLRGRDLRELRERGHQAFAAWRERAGFHRGALADAPDALGSRLASGVPASPAALLERFRAAPPPFFAAFDDPAATIAALRAHAPGDEGEVVARAARVLEGHFDLMGHRGLSYGAPIDWQRDPLAGTSAPREHWSRVPYLDPARVGDHKVVWELSRQQFLVTLGQAYWYTGDARYAHAFAGLVTDWLDANPPKIGMNWTSSLEVAFRAMSWLWALRFFRHAEALTPALYGRLLGALHVHAEHLATYLSTYFSPNTHLTGEALGLVMIGSLAPELGGAERWRTLGLAILHTQLDRQLRPDGVYFEQASQYHRYTVEFYLHLQLLAERRGEVAPARLREAVPQLLEFLAALTRPDGTIPLFGDDDGGRLVQLDGRTPDDVRALLLTAGLALDRADWRALGHADPAAALWLLGPEAGRRLDPASPPPPPAATGRAFAASGFYVLRDGHGAMASHALLDAGAHGVMNCGHAHADALALLLTLRGRHLFVDAGTYTYPGAERNVFRAAESHNVVLVDGVGSSVPAPGFFQWSAARDARALRWAAHARFDWVVGAVSGFGMPGDRTEHERLVLRAGDRGWLVRDRLRNARARTVEARWLLAPGLGVELSEAAGPLATADVRDVDGRAVARVAALGAGAWRVEPAWVSPQYGARVPAERLVWDAGPNADDLVTVILPPDASGALPTLRLAACQGEGVSVAIERAGSHGALESDLLLVRNGSGALATGEVTADADCAWLWADAAVALEGEFRALPSTAILEPRRTPPRDRVPGRWQLAVRTDQHWELEVGAARHPDAPGDV